MKGRILTVERKKERESEREKESEKEKEEGRKEGRKREIYKIRGIDLVIFRIFLS